MIYFRIKMGNLGEKLHLGKVLAFAYQWNILQAI